MHEQFAEIIILTQKNWLSNPPPCITILWSSISDDGVDVERQQQGRRKVWNSGGGEAHSNLVGIICPPVETWLTDLAISGRPPQLRQSWLLQQPQRRPRHRHWLQRNGWGASEGSHFGSYFVFDKSWYTVHMSVSQSLILNEEQWQVKIKMINLNPGVLF